MRDIFLLENEDFLYVMMLIVILSLLWKILSNKPTTDIKILMLLIVSFWSLYGIHVYQVKKGYVMEEKTEKDIQEEHVKDSCRDNDK